MEAPPQMPQTSAYLIFCGLINQASTQKLLASVNESLNAQSKDIHLFFQSYGGYVGDAVALYDFFRSLPQLSARLTIYNAGTIRSAAVTAYLGAERRLVAPCATFMLHRCMHVEALSGATAVRLRAAADDVMRDDAISREIIERHVTDLAGGWWDTLQDGALYFSAKEALAAHIATEEGDWSPPRGAHIKVL